MKPPKRILIVRPDRIGDVILSTPLPREIKKNYPDSSVALMLRKYTKDIYENNPYVDKIILIDDYDDGSMESFWKKVDEIRRYKFTHALTLLPNERINYLLFFAGIPNRVGVGHKFYQFITFTKYVSRKKYNPLRHEADYCMDLARKIGVVSNDLKTEIFLKEEEKNKSFELRSNLLKGKKYLVGIHTTSGNSAPNWSTFSYIKLIRKLEELDDIQIVLTDDRPSEELLNIDNVKHPNLGKSLRESFITFNALDLLISASTGPMHICAALNVKTLSMFCPLTACSPKLWGPIGNVSKVILPSENYCSNKCPGDPKRCKFEGDGGISVDQIVTALTELLQ